MGLLQGLDRLADAPAPEELAASGFGSQARPNAEEQARRLLRRLELPEQAARVLEHERYWNPIFCSLYLDACDQQLFEDPRAGLPMAELAPKLSECLPESREKNDLRVRALALLGGANRANGNLFESAATYHLAFRVAERSTISPAILGDLNRRFSSLLIEQGRWTEAARVAQVAIEIFEKVPSGVGDFCLGAALVQRGLIRLGQNRVDEAIRDFGMALTALDPKRNERSYYAAAHNLAFALTSATDLQQIRQATRYLRYARELLKGQRASLARFKLYYLEAQVLSRLGSTRRAEKNLHIARDGFQRIGAFQEYLTLSLELAAVCQTEGRFQELRVITEEALAACEGRGYSAEVLALLATWRKAVEEQRASALFFEGLSRELGGAFKRSRRKA